MKSYNRYHRYDMYGNKYIKRFELDQIPKTMPDEGYTEWIRGTGPFNEQQLANVTTAVRKACKGIPKKPETKQKMSVAKLGKPKTEEHKNNMKLSWERKRIQAGTTSDL
jgi:hypothetical protein